MGTTSRGTGDRGYHAGPGSALPLIRELTAVILAAGGILATWDLCRAGRLEAHYSAIVICACAVRGSLALIGQKLGIAPPKGPPSEAP